MTLHREQPLILDIDGEVALGIAHIPDHSVKTGILMVPGAPQYRAGPHRLFVSLARHLAGQGFSVLRADRRGLGDSDGEQIAFDHMAPDMASALSALKAADPRVERVLLLGLCDGASASMLHGSQHREVSGMLLLNPWVSTRAGRAQAVLKGYYLPRLARWRRWLAVLGSFARLRRAVVNISRALIASMKPASGTDAAPSFAVDMLKQWIDFDGKVLVVLSGQDIDATAFDRFIHRTLGWSPLTEAARTHLVRLRTADHTFTDLKDREILFAEIDQWLAAFDRA
ncbi:MAG: hydrolase 1, exosortase A system-associated [Alphaproteobacteria bacterium]